MEELLDQLIKMDDSYGWRSGDPLVTAKLCNLVIVMAAKIQILEERLSNHDQCMEQGSPEEPILVKDK